MAIVVDASYVVGALLQDETSAPDGRSLHLVLGEAVIVPAHWPAEMGNALLVAHRRGRIGSEDLDEALSVLARLPVAVAPAGTSLRPATALARRHGLTLYDALYLDLAVREAARLASLDRRLRAAAAREGIPLFGDPRP
jgi:predicted nucleic acid-binding protein